MSNRCEECSKFVSLEMGDPEIDSSDVNDSVIQGSVRLYKQCCECGTEMAEAYPEFEIDIQEHVPEGKEDGEHDMKEDCEWSIESEEVEQHERGEGFGRYMKTFYGAELTFQVQCSCGFEAEVKGITEEQASSFDEC